MKYRLNKRIGIKSKMNGALFLADGSGDDMFKFTDHNQDIVEMALDGLDTDEIVNRLNKSYEFDGDPLDEYVKSFLDSLVRLDILDEAP